MITKNFKNPAVILLPNPTDLDRVIQEIQCELGAITWLEKIFGRAKEIARKVGNETKREPMVYQGSKEYYPVLPNDALKSYSFFRCNAGRVATDYESNSPSNYYTAATDLIVWADLIKIDSSRDFPFTEELIHEVVTVLNRNSNVIIRNIFDDKADDIFRGYTLQPTHRDLLMIPYQAFRIEMTLNYKIDC